MRQISFLLLLAVVFGSCRSAPRDIVIFHTNDIHGRFTAEPADWREDRALTGGFAALSHYLDSLRRACPRSLYVDAGDLMTGNPICDIEYNAVKGGALLEMLNRCRITAMCLGNHEFDLGADHLRDFTAASPFPMLCANLRDKTSLAPVTSPSRIVNVRGVRVGLVGVLLDDVADVVRRPALEPFFVDDAAVSAQREIDRLDPSTDLIVILSHMGVDADSVMATKLRGADVIVGGHSHTRLQKTKRVNGVVIVQAGAYLKNLGVLRLRVDGDSVAGYDGRLVELRMPKTLPRNDVASFADSLEIVVQSRYGQVIGDLETPWRSTYNSGSNAGNWICDRLRARYRTDVALMNAGGIRGNVDPGPITKLDVLQLLPFPNGAVLFNATGADLRKVAEEQARAQGLRAHGALEMSGMDVKFCLRNGSAQVRNVTVGGRPLNDKSVYRVASIDYVVFSQWERYLGFKPTGVEATGELLSEAIIEEISVIRSPIRADDAPRLSEVP